jgi:hypothetical protein
MADYNTEASFEFKVSSPEAMAYAEELYEKGFVDEGMEEEWDFRAEFNKAEKSIWISSQNESFNVDQAVEFVQSILKKDESKDVVFFEWANTCTKPRLDGFGGGAVAVSADDAEWIIPSQQQDKAIKALTLRREVTEVMAAGEFDQDAQDDLDNLVDDYRDNLVSAINNGGAQAQVEFLLEQDPRLKETLIKLVKASPGVTPKG